MTDAPAPRDQTPEGWDDVAKAYDRAITRITGLYAEDAVRALDISAGQRILDIAAGPGTASVIAAGYGADVLAVDYSPSMIDQLRAKVADLGLSIEAAVMDGQALDLADASMDAVVCVFGLMFFPDQPRGCAEALRVLKPGGTAAMATWAHPEKNLGLTVWREAAERALPNLPKPDAMPAVFSLFDPEALSGLMRGSGFEDVEVRPVVHAWTFDSAENFWEDFHEGSPVFQALAGLIGDRFEDVHDSFIQIMHERCGEGAISFDAEALLATGRKG